MCPQEAKVAHITDCLILITSEMVNTCSSYRIQIEIWVFIASVYWHKRSAGSGLWKAYDIQWDIYWLCKLFNLKNFHLPDLSSSSSLLLKLQLQGLLNWGCNENKHQILYGKSTGSNPNWIMFRLWLHFDILSFPLNCPAFLLHWWIAPLKSPLYKIMGQIPLHILGTQSWLYSTLFHI